MTFKDIQIINNCLSTNTYWGHTIHSRQSLNFIIALITTESCLACTLRNCQQNLITNFGGGSFWTHLEKSCFNFSHPTSLPFWSLSAILIFNERFFYIWCHHGELTKISVVVKCLKLLGWNVVNGSMHKYAYEYF